MTGYITYNLVTCRDIHKKSKMGFVASAFAEDKADSGNLRHWLKGHIPNPNT